MSRIPRLLGLSVALIALSSASAFASVITSQSVWDQMYGSSAIPFPQPVAITSVPGGGGASDTIRVQVSGDTIQTGYSEVSFCPNNAPSCPGIASTTITLPYGISAIGGLLYSDSFPQMRIFGTLAQPTSGCYVAGSPYIFCSFLGFDNLSTDSIVLQIDTIDEPIYYQWQNVEVVPVSADAVPEPAAILLFGAGLAALSWLRKAAPRKEDRI